jgi:hypothetical protein
MSTNSDFHSVDFFRGVRDKHADLLSNMGPDEIIAFFENQEESNNSATPDHGLAARRSRADQPARGGVR